MGADPGGADKFGLATIDAHGGMVCNTVSSVDEAIEFITAMKITPSGLGIDAPMWWSSGNGGGRKVDEKIRSKYGIHPGTVQSVNSLRGAALVGGALLAFRIRRAYAQDIGVTEAHPKALLLALDLSWEAFACKYSVPTHSCRNEHERDAAISAVCAREGFKKRWHTDLAGDRHLSEQDIQSYWLSPMHYFWPEAI